jgi:hypothetical protein
VCGEDQDRFGPGTGASRLYYNRAEGVIDCGDDDELGARTLLGTESPATKLRVKAVKRLGRGKHVTVSGRSPRRRSEMT